MICFGEAGLAAFMELLQRLESVDTQPVGASIALAYDDTEKRVLALLNADIGQVMPGRALPGYSKIRVMAGPDWDNSRAASFDFVPVTVNGYPWFELVESVNQIESERRICLDRPGIVDGK